MGIGQWAEIKASSRETPILQAVFYKDNRESNKLFEAIKNSK